MSMSDPSPDAFTAVANLLAVIGDPELASKRLDELRTGIERAAAMQRGPGGRSDAQAGASAKL
jgi:hypothetical protein